MSLIQESFYLALVHSFRLVFLFYSSHLSYTTACNVIYCLYWYVSDLNWSVRFKKTILNYVERRKRELNFLKMLERHFHTPLVIVFRFNVQLDQDFRTYGPWAICNSFNYQSPGICHLCLSDPYCLSEPFLWSPCSLLYYLSFLLPTRFPRWNYLGRLIFFPFCFLLYLIFKFYFLYFFKNCLSCCNHTLFLS